MKPYLSVQNLTKTFTQKKSGVLTAVQGVSFSLFRGETLGIVGESGSGKSTLARLITRRIDPTGGTILLDGTDITRLKGKALRPVYRSMQMVFQHPAASFDPRRTLDATVQQQILSLLRRLQKERFLSYLFICHNLALVQSFCDRVLVMHDGRIVEEGTPDDILFHPTSDYTKELVKAAF